MFIKFIFRFFKLLIKNCSTEKNCNSFFVIFPVSHKVVVVADTPIQVDRTPPTGGRVSDSNMVTSDADYQGSTTTLCVSWDRFTDPHTGISLYQWNAGTSPGSDDTISQRNMTELEVMDRSACMSGLSLSNGVTYYSTIVAYNGAETRLSVAVDF